jgi:hypothetical protein
MAIRNDECCLSLSFPHSFRQLAIPCLIPFKKWKMTRREKVENKKAEREYKVVFNEGDSSFVHFYEMGVKRGRRKRV